jgi:hypothetical protein
VNRLLSYYLAPACQWSNRVSVPLFVVAGICSALCCETHAANYTFTKIADWNTAAPIGTFRGIGFSAPSISGDTVAFAGDYGSGRGVFTSSGEALTTIAKSGDAAPIGAFEIFLYPDAEGNQVAFLGGYRDDASRSLGILAGNGGPLTKIVVEGDAIPSRTLTHFFPEHLTMSGGVIAFHANSTGGDVIFVAEGGTIREFVKRGDIAPNGAEFSQVSNPKIDGRSVAFYGQTSNSSGIFLSNGETLTTIVKTGDPAPNGTFVRLTPDAAISEDRVAFEGSYYSPNGLWANGLFIGDGTTIQTVVKYGDPAPFGEFYDFSGLSIVGRTVAFVGLYAESGRLGRG